MNSDRYSGKGDKAQSCATDGCFRRTWNGLSGATCCRTCARTNGADHGQVCERNKAELTDDSLRIAVDLWFSDQAQCIAQVGHISDWRVREVTNMAELFRRRAEFNEDISRWGSCRVCAT